MIMETKKSAQAIIENKRFSLALMGLSVAGALTLMSFEYRNFEIQYNKSLTGISEPNEIQDVFTIVQIEKPIEQEVKKPLPPVIIPTTTPISSSTDPSEVSVDPTASVDDGPILNGDLSIGTTGDNEEPEIDDSEYIFVSESPSFPGGDIAFRNFLNKNTIYPQIAIENNMQGKVHVSFVVEKNGSITDVQIVQGINKHLDKEAIRVIQSMPNWIPGKQGNKTVRVRYTLPVNFILG